jgi:hypothetical protein
MSELTRAELKVLLERSAELIRQAQAIQADLQRASAAAKAVVAPRQATRRKAARKAPK